MNCAETLTQLFNCATNSVRPDRLIQKFVARDNNKIVIAEQAFTPKNVYVIGAGKASALMAKQLEICLGNVITAGHVIVKHGHACPVTRIQIHEAGHPTPDEHSFAATRKVLALARQADENDLVICLISGGGSTLLADCPATVTQAELMTMNQILVQCGANIHEINSVRKHLSRVKGGWLAREISPATTVSLILSDVIGDPLDVIASGPTSPDSTNFADAQAVLVKHGLLDRIPQSIRQHLQQGLDGQIEESPKLDDAIFERVHNLIIGSNRIALQAALAELTRLGISGEIVSSTLNLDSYEAAQQIIATSLHKQQNLPAGKRCCLLFGGEPTLSVKGNGKGGRNQHLALYAAWVLREHKGITLLAAGTDGNDGPTDAAGALVDTTTWHRAFAHNIDGRIFLEHFASYAFFKAAGGHLITGPTGTNVMDLIIVLIDSPQ